MRLKLWRAPQSADPAEAARMKKLFADLDQRWGQIPNPKRVYRVARKDTGNLVGYSTDPGAPGVEVTRAFDGLIVSKEDWPKVLDHLKEKIGKNWREHTPLG